MNTTTAMRLRRLNLGAAILHLAQGAIMLALSSDFALPVTNTFLRFDPARQPPTLPAPEVWFRLRLGPAIAAFLFLSAAAHLLIAAPRIFSWYVRNADRGINPARWIEYSLSSSVMIVVVAMLSGIYDAAALIPIFAVNATMILFGWMMELHNQSTRRTDWTAYRFGVVAGVVPWIVIGLYLFGAGGEEGGPPGFVYAIFFSIFLFFNVFAVNMALQYGKVGRWRDYLHGERAYILLSLTAKSALAWQVFGGTLR